MTPVRPYPPVPSSFAMMKLKWRVLLPKVLWVLMLVSLIRAEYLRTWVAEGLQ